MATQVNICNLALRMIGANTITAIDDGTKEAYYCSDFWSYIIEEVMEDYAWGFTQKTRLLNFTDGFGYYNDDAKTITGITQADPGVVTIASHGYETGYTVQLTDISGMTELNNGIYEIIDLTDNTFSLVDIDTSVMTAYTSGGEAIRKEVISAYQNGYTYDVPTDMLLPIGIEGDADFIVLGNAGDSNHRICTSVDDASLIYIANESTTTNMSNRFIMAVARRLAAELSLPLSKKGAVAEKMWSLYE